jgi:hypothetical protein
LGPSGPLLRHRSQTRIWDVGCIPATRLNQLTGEIRPPESSPCATCSSGLSQGAPTQVYSCTASTTLCSGRDGSCHQDHHPEEAEHGIVPLTPRLVSGNQWIGPGTAESRQTCRTRFRQVSGKHANHIFRPKAVPKSFASEAPARVPSTQFSRHFSDLCFQMCFASSMCPGLSVEAPLTNRGTGVRGTHHV